MLEIGKFYKGTVEGNSYKCLDIQNNTVTMWMLEEIPLENPVLLERKDGMSEPLRTISLNFKQDLAYQDQYKLITDDREIQRLSQIFNRQHTDHEKKVSRIVPLKQYPITQQQFDAVMEEVDSELKTSKVAVANRSFHAIPIFSKKLNVDNFLVCGGEPTPGYYTSHNLGAHIHQWYEIKYGDKMKKDFRLGRMILVVKGECFMVGFPLLFGRAKLICDPTLRKYPSMGVNASVIINLLATIEGLTQALAAKLTEQELKELLTLYGSTYNAITNYEESGLAYKREALTDLETAVDSFFYTRQQYGQSKWHSLQFAEKLLKGVIDSYGKPYPFTHKLKELAKIINDLSGIQIDNDILKDIDCKPDVRYSADIVSEEDAIKAHHASLALLRSVMDQLPNKRNLGLG